ncbi:MAG: DUF1353 domain-containing protein [Verrucomicrobia bacterium]|nr:DUF1353 domain-containing protein [Verrucomicrobiota bacterium]
MSFDVLIEQTIGLETVDVDTRLFRLFRDYHCHINNMPVVVPEGTLTDLASVPRAAKIIIDDDDPHILRAAVLHDWLYQNHGHVIDKDGHLLASLTRRECDDILQEAMRCCRATWPERAVVYLAVRIGGWVPWNKPNERKTAMRATFRAVQAEESIT